MNLPRGVRPHDPVDGDRPDVSMDVDQELSFHFEQMIQALEAKGMDREEAEGEARRRFGDEDAYRRKIEKIDRRRMRMRRQRAVVETFVEHLAFSLRRIRRSPGFSAAVVVILALGIGANAVMFGVVDRLLLSPPQHVENPDQVRHIYLKNLGFRGQGRTSRVMTYSDYVDFKSVGAFQSVAAYANPRQLTMGQGAEAEQVWAELATASLFPLLGVSAERGRFFTEEEAAVGGVPTIVLAHEFWARRFGEDPDILGRTLEIGQGSYTVIGVAPPGFTGAELDPVDVWLPLERTQENQASSFQWRDNRNYWFLWGVARLAPGVVDAAAQAEATAIHRGARAELIEQGQYDAEAEVIPASIISARGPTPSNETRVAGWLAGVSLIVLLIACFNVANLLLARAIHWRRETAVRAALGGSRSRILGQHLTESLILAGLGATAALGVARWGGDDVHQVLLPNVAFTDGGVGARLLLFLAVATVLTALFAGTVPALQASRTDTADALKTGGHGGIHGRSKTRVALLVAQAALSVILLVGAGLFVQSLQEARTQDLGFDATRVAVVQLQWNETLPGEERQAIFQEVLERAQALPTVQEAGLSLTIPFWSLFTLGDPRVPGMDSVPADPLGRQYAMNRVGAGYFEAMGLSILRGRPIQGSDEGEGAGPVAVVSNGMATAIWPETSAIGECMILGNDEDAPCTRVVGVVEDHNLQEVDEEHPQFTYFLNTGHPAALGPPQALMVRTTGPAEDQAAHLRSTLVEVSSQIRFADVWSLQSRVERQLRSWRLGASMFTIFGILALVVAACGLYSVLAFDVALRRPELGIRSALGAGVPRLVRSVLVRAVVMVGVGVVIGLGVALAAAGFVQPLLYRVSATNPAVYLGVAGAMLAVAAVAGSIPAWRASRVDPREALQAE